MSAVDWALTRDLSAPKKLLLVALAWIADEDGATFKGQRTIASRLAKDPRWVREHIGALADEGLLTRYERRRPNGSRTTDLIVLSIPRAEPFDISAYDATVSGAVGIEPHDDEFPPVPPPAGSRRPSGGFPPGHTNQPPNHPPLPPSGGSGSADALATVTDITPERRLCRKLAESIKERDPKAKTPPNPDRWLRDMRLLIKDRDGDVAEVERVLDFSQRDPFWQANILSPGKLRKQFSRLVMEVGRGSRVATSAPGASHYAAMAQRFAAEEARA